MSRYPFVDKSYYRCSSGIIVGICKYHSYILQPVKRQEQPAEKLRRRRRIIGGYRMIGYKQCAAVNRNPDKVLKFFLRQRLEGQGIGNPDCSDIKHSLRLLAKLYHALTVSLGRCQMDS